MRDDKNSWLWLRKGYLKKETEGLLLAAQDQALRTRWIMKYSSLARLILSLVSCIWSSGSSCKSCTATPDI